VADGLALAELLEVRLPLREAFVTGFGSTDTRRTVLVHLVGRDGAEGWGEAAALDHPFYLPDTTSGTFALAAEWALPLALAGDPAPRAVAGRLGVIRGNTFARAGVEAAFWCLEAARRGVRLADLLAAEAGAATGPRVPVGESVGIHPSVDATLGAVRRALATGYRRIKLKVRPGWDVALVAAVRDLVGPDVMLQVDANGSYSLSPEDVDRLHRLDRYDLACIEQPLGWDDLDGHARLQSEIRTPVCLDECLRSAADVRRALDLGACRNVNLKPGRVGGAVASLEVRRICADAGVALWCGGMLESGVGRALNLALASLDGFTDPADMSPAAELYDFDLVDPTYGVDPDGTVAVPTGTGLGLPVTRGRVDACTLRRVEVPVTSSPR
jgi:O-succinylbenzoate synthase